MLCGYKVYDGQWLIKSGTIELDPKVLDSKIVKFDGKTYRINSIEVGKTPMVLYLEEVRKLVVYRVAGERLGEIYWPMNDLPTPGSFVLVNGGIRNVVNAYPIEGHDPRVLVE